MITKDTDFVNPFRTTRFQRQGTDELGHRLSPARITMSETQALAVLTDDGFKRWLAGEVIRPRDIQMQYLIQAAMNPQQDMSPALWALVVLLGLKALGAQHELS